ncbi:MAG: L,D-transpeptidase [Gammaproteobacteria bacterium]|nr:L,D-transpeptidase [Gammaproteobacteria bacterium]
MVGMAACLCFGLLGIGCTPLQVIEPDNAAQRPDPQPNPMLHATYSADAEVPFVVESRTDMADGSKQVNFESRRASRKTRDMADWVVNSSDNRNMPFAIVDKVNAKTYIFDVDGRLHGAAPVLLGVAKGDHTAPGIGNIPMSRIPTEDRTTPAGRFVATMGHNSRGKEILWVDYENAISMHPVITTKPEERRLQRLATPTPLDNRISYGCINVPAEFFKNVVHKTFAGTRGIVYVLPEMDLPIQNTRLTH